MSTYAARKTRQRFLKVVQGMAAGSSLFIGAVVQADTKAEDAHWTALELQVISNVKMYAPHLLVGVGVLMALCSLVLWASKPAGILKAVETKLDAIRDWACCDAQEDVTDNHRVTVFEYKSTYWGLWRKRRHWTYKYFPWSLSRNPWSGWLVPVARSGHTSQNPKSAFWAPDNGNEAEGIAGQAWARNSTVFVPKLPAVSTLTSDRNVDKYCKESWTPRSVVETYREQDRQPARAFLAFPILSNDGHPWGVVVLDSQSPEGILSEEIQRVVSVSCPVLAVLLEEL